MLSRLMYIELKTDYSDRGPAWIGKAFFSKTGRTVYFNGLILKYGRGGEPGNYYDADTGEYYWVSGIKKDGTDRHWAGGGKISIDRSVVEEYLALTKDPSLTKGKFDIVELDNVPKIAINNAIENQVFDIN